MFRASAFKLRMYEVCPQQYKFTYIDYLSDQYKKPKPYLTMGAHVHNALKDYYELYPPEERSWEHLEALLRKRWRENRTGFKDRDDEAKWGLKALQMLKQFFYKNDVAINPVMLEDYYDADVAEDIKVIGRIDRADETEEGLHVIDYKTGKFDEEDVSDMQLQIYALITEANEKRPVTKASYLYLATNKWYTIDISPESIQEARQEMINRVRQIQQETSFDPNINKYCKHCDFIEICPKQTEIRQLMEAGEL